VIKKWTINEGKTGDVISTEFDKAFCTDSHNIFIDKLIKHGLGKWSVSWTEN